MTNVLASPLEGEADFQFEQWPAKTRKPGEGNRNQCKIFNPSPNFSNTRGKTSRIEKYPPLKKESQGARV